MNDTVQEKLPEYYGTKRIAAKPMTRLEYNHFRKWELPKDENGEDEGYLVEYLDGGKPNVEGYAGYISWSPKEQFDAAYQATNRMSFGHALVALQDGEKVCRKGWNGKGMFIVMVPATPNCKLREGTPYYNALNNASAITGSVTINAHIDMYTATGEMQPGWLASQTDMLAQDWQIADGKQIDDAVLKEANPLQKVETGAAVQVNLLGILRTAAGRVHKDSGVASDVTGAVVQAFEEALQAAVPRIEEKATDEKKAEEAA